MRPALLLCWLFLAPLALLAQREYAVCDSTFYPLNADTTLVAGRYALYLQTSGGTALLADFSLPDPDQYIRDFDLVTPDRWYTLIGSRYIGGPTTLWRSEDRGTSWQVDSSFYATARTVDPSANYWNSVNTLQHFGADTLILFMAYYQSGVMYSVDGGASWTNWIYNLITHYHAIFQCDTTYYLFGLEGDAFRSWAFPFPRYKLFRNDSLVNFQVFGGTGDHPFCSNGDSGCIYVPYNLSRCGMYNYMRNYVDSLCQLTTGIGTYEERAAAKPILYPNPGNGLFRLHFPERWQGEVSLAIFDMTGRVVRQLRSFEKSPAELDLRGLDGGTYYLRVRSGQYEYILKCVIH